MTRIKLCGLTRPCDIAYANALLPEYIGFVFAQKSSRYLSPEQAAVLAAQLDSRITPVGVFVDEAPERIAALVHAGTIRAVQLHGHEDAAYIARLRQLTNCPVIQAFCIRTLADIRRANRSPADLILLEGFKDSGYPKLELIRGTNSSDCVCRGRNLRAVVTDLPPGAVKGLPEGVPVFGLKDVENIAEFILKDLFPLSGNTKEII